MAIDYVLLTDTFGHWVITTNEIIDELNREVLADLLTADKTSLVAAINELYNNKYDKTGGTISGSAQITGNLGVEGVLQLGEDGGGSTSAYFWDDTANEFREIRFQASTQTWRIEDKNAVMQSLFHSGLNINLGTLSNLNTDTQILFKGGTTAENDAYTGGLKELTVDTEAGTIRLHDGITPGGIVISGGGGAPTVDSFAVGVDYAYGGTILNLSVAPASKDHTRVMMNGLYQHKSTYNVAGTVLTFTSPILNGVSSIEVEILG